MAQGEPRQHEIFSKPSKVQPAFEFWKTPSNYRGYPGGKDLPDKIRVWRVQNTGKGFGSVASRCHGFEDSLEARILTAGFNVGKGGGAVGVGRQGNFLQWGFSAPPSRMKEAGKCFFLNCICFPMRWLTSGSIGDSPRRLQAGEQSQAKAGIAVGQCGRLTGETSGGRVTAAQP